MTKLAEIRVRHKAELEKIGIIPSIDFNQAYEDRAYLLDLVTKLLGYADHKSPHPCRHFGNNPPCTCGLTALLDETKE